MAALPDLRQLDRAWQQCRRRKRHTPQAQAYELRLLDNLMDTVEALQEGSWRPVRPVCFVVDRPKAREIHAAAFCDRVVHHWLVPHLEAIHEPIFIHDVYSNRQGKGTHRGVRRLQSFMHSLRAKEGKPGYYLQLDIANFFVTVDRPLLFSLLQKHLRKALSRGRLSVPEAHMLRSLCHTLLRQDVGREARCLASPAQMRCVPEHKRLDAAPPDKGLPIGNLTSQHFANVYLNELDQFIKHRLKCRYYLRYVDDMVLLHADPNRLGYWQREIASFLAQRLKLTLRADWRLAPVDRGVDFLGYIVRPHYRLVRRRVVGNLRERLDGFENAMIRLRPNGRLAVDEAQLRAIHSCLASYWGHFRHADAWRLMDALWRRYGWLGLFFNHRAGRLSAAWYPRQVSGYAAQVRYFRRRFPHARVLVQKGWNTEDYPPWSPCPAGVPRPTDPCGRVRQANIVEDGYLKGGLKRRRLDSLYFETGENLCQN